MSTFIKDLWPKFSLVLIFREILLRFGRVNDTPFLRKSKKNAFLKESEEFFLLSPFRNTKFHEIIPFQQS